MRTGTPRSFIRFHGAWTPEEKQRIKPAVKEAEVRQPFPTPPAGSSGPGFALWTLARHSYATEQAVYVAHRTGWPKASTADSVEELVQKIQVHP